MTQTFRDGTLDEVRSAAASFRRPTSRWPETLLRALAFSCGLSGSSVAHGGKAREGRSRAGERAATETHGQYPSWHREEPGWNGTGCCRKTCSYKPATRRRGAGRLPEAKDRRKQPDEDATRAC